MANLIRNLIDAHDYTGLQEALLRDPGLANAGIPYDDVNTALAHPLHRVCDAVFEKKLSQDEAIKFAKIFLEYGANINGNEQVKMRDTPLIAAASMYADEVAVFYLDNGADVHHQGCHGGTALHWAAWCGRDRVVRRLIESGADVNRLCVDFNATPLFWAVHGLTKGGQGNIHNQRTCAEFLIQSGADKHIPNGDGHTVFDLLGDLDEEWRSILR